jgi:hypothetical protein
VIVHDAIGAAVHPLIKAVSRLTGRPSWSLAMPALKAGLVFDWAYAGWQAPFDSIRTTFVLAALSFLVYYFYLYPYVKAGVERAEREASSTSGTTTLGDSWDELLVWRMLLPIIIVIHLSAGIGGAIAGDLEKAGSLVAAASDLLYIYAIWAVYFVEPGGKSVFARIKEKVESMVPSVGGVLTPSPVPA